MPTGIYYKGHDLNNIRYTDNTMLVADTEKKTAGILRQGSRRKWEERTKH